MSNHRIQVSEPWDFEHPNGTNIFDAEYIGVIEMEPKENWQERYLLLDVTDPFVFEDDLVSQILCAPRYTGDSLFEVSKLGTVGISRVLPGIKINEKSNLDPSQVKYFAIGELTRQFTAVQVLKRMFLSSSRKLDSR